MTSSEAFKAWFKAYYIKHGFISSLKEAEEIWQAAYEAGRTAEKQECKRVCELEINRLSAIGEHRAALAVGICSTKIDERGRP